MKRIVFSGGGTGGHVFPAIAVYQNIKEKIDDYLFFWIGSNGLEKNIIKNYSDIEYYSIKCGKLRRYFSLKNLLDAFKVLIGIFQAFFILKKLRADIVFSKGGYVSTPTVIAARFLKIKVFTHESDFDIGLANRINSKFCTKILLSYIESKKFFKEYDKKK